MRTAAFAIALLISGAAIAQTTTTQTTQPDVDVDADVGVQPDGELDVDADVDVGTKTTTSTTTHGSHGTHATHGNQAMGTTMAGGGLVQPGNSDPELDARGIPVISAPAVAPTGWNGAGGAAVGGPLVEAAGQTSLGADASYPACTSTVTDNCVQAYERGRIRR